mmetsp:Transcript_102459/g.330572  ORF Transcript_102459/g.330572 Transcript_102459/m.330572 type:complete len:236 (+) Transcript_102459:212-919(+)
MLRLQSPGSTFRELLANQTSGASSSSWHGCSRQPMPSRSSSLSPGASTTTHQCWRWGSGPLLASALNVSCLGAGSELGVRCAPIVPGRGCGMPFASAITGAAQSSPSCAAPRVPVFVARDARGSANRGRVARRSGYHSGPPPQHHGLSFVISAPALPGDRSQSPRVLGRRQVPLRAPPAHQKSSWACSTSSWARPAEVAAERGASGVTAVAARPPPVQQVAANQASRHSPCLTSR